MHLERRRAWGRSGDDKCHCSTSIDSNSVLGNTAPGLTCGAKIEFLEFPDFADCADFPDFADFAGGDYPRISRISHNCCGWRFFADFSQLLRVAIFRGFHKFADFSRISAQIIVISVRSVRRTRKIPRPPTIILGIHSIIPIQSIKPSENIGKFPSFQGVHWFYKDFTNYCAKSMDFKLIFV